jgi:hypothetical protein
MTDSAEKTSRAIDYTKRMSINFIGVRKQRSAEQKQQVYDAENFTFLNLTKWSDMIMRLKII